MAVTARPVLVMTRRRPGSGHDISPVFVVGSPRSGTTFLGRAIAAAPGFVDCDELPEFKPKLPDLLRRRPRALAAEIRQAILDVMGDPVCHEMPTAEADTPAGSGHREPSGRMLRPVVHAPELAFVAHALKHVGERVSVIHIVRDGRDVTASLMRDGWLSASNSDRDVNDWQLGNVPRFWTEPSRRREFSEVSDARRAAWCWRRYVSAALDLAAPGRASLMLHYEQLCSDPQGVGRVLAPAVGCDTETLVEQLSYAHTGSIGRYLSALSPGDLEDVDAEASQLMNRLGYY